MFNLDLRAKVLKIKLVAFDVDGVMTDGGMIYDENGIQYKIFNTKDGQGIAMLVKSGIKTAIITAKESGAVAHRFKDLGMTKLYQGQKNKEYADTRKSQVGTGDRSERIRTYNFPQGRITDHRINYTSYNLTEFMNGEIDELLTQLQIEDQKRKLENL